MLIHICRRLFFIGLALLAAEASAEVTFTYQGTVLANNSLGYTTGQAVTFVYTLNDYSPKSPVGQASAGYNYVWSEEFTNEPLLWADITGTGLSGSWTRPTANNYSPSSSLNASSGGDLQLIAKLDSGSIGLTRNSSSITRMQFEALFDGLDFNPVTGTLPDPTAYFSTLAGTYAAQSSGMTAYIQTASGSAYFNLSSLTIASPSNIPEPASSAALAGLVPLAWVLLRRRRA